MTMITITSLIDKHKHTRLSGFGIWFLGPEDPSFVGLIPTAGYMETCQAYIVHHNGSASILPK